MNKRKNKLIEMYEVEFQKTPTSEWKKGFFYCGDHGMEIRIYLHPKDANDVGDFYTWRNFNGGKFKWTK